MIDLHDRDGIALVCLDHGKVNALDVELLHAISAAMAEVADARAVVLTGTGRTFSAGVDLRRVVDGGAEYLREFLPALSEALLSVFDCPRPLVAAVNGHAIAGGCVLAAAADARLMSAGTIGLTELLVGVPFPIAALEIVRHATGPKASALALTGKALDAEQAVAIGLVDEVVIADDLLDLACIRAEALATLPPDVYATTKEQLHRPARLLIDEHRDADDEIVLRQWSSARARAAIAEYLAGIDRRHHDEPS
jgi:enoyl-CoA hydratase